MDLWHKFKTGLEKTSAQIEKAFRLKHLDNQTLDLLEEALITADIGVQTSEQLIDVLKKQKPQTQSEAKDILFNQIYKILSPCEQKLSLSAQNTPFIILMVGVNGSGKTTTVGKLAYQMRQKGLQVGLAAADTFRMAAIEQLKEWADKTDCHFYSSHIGADPAGTAYDAVQQSIKNQDNVLFIDTAGRLQNKSELMAELQKMIKVIKKIDPSAPHATLLTLDATTGQNVLSQAEIFQQTTNVNGLVMCKLDGTAKGGSLVALTQKFNLPIYFIGVGEQYEDLIEFNATDYTKSLLGYTQ